VTPLRVLAQHSPGEIQKNLGFSGCLDEMRSYICPRDTGSVTILHRFSLILPSGFPAEILYAFFFSFLPCVLHAIIYIYNSLINIELTYNWVSLKLRFLKLISTLKTNYTCQNFIYRLYLQYLPANRIIGFLEVYE
jgi:hypothetical protein